MNQWNEWRKYLVETLDRGSWIPPLLARLSVGWVMAESGWGKLQNLDKVTEFFTEIGIPAPHLQAPFVAGTELICGLLLLIGFFTRLAAVPLAATMVVAIVTVKRSEISSLSDLFGFSEYLYIVLLVWLVFTGAGCFSLDQFLCDRRAKNQGGPKGV